MNASSISPAELLRRHREGTLLNLIDVRTPAEFRDRHVEFARNVPIDQLDPSVIKASNQATAGAETYFICQSGGRSRRACEAMIKAGLAGVVDVEGGTLACEKAGLPIVRGKSTMSLERQVRIAAGSLVVTGVVLAWLVNPLFIGLSAFVGAGLVFAGVTDTCAMGMLIAKMPWNHVSS